MKEFDTSHLAELADCLTDGRPLRWIRSQASGNGWKKQLYEPLFLGVIDRSRNSLSVNKSDDRELIL